MDLQVIIGAVTEELRTPGSEIGESGDELFGGCGGCLFEVNCGHVCSFQSSSSIRLCLYLINQLGQIHFRSFRLKAVFHRGLCQLLELIRTCALETRRLVLRW